MTAHRIGIIGVGFGLQVHVPGFRSEGWEVVALCSRDREKARKAADQAGIAQVFTDPTELLERGDIDAVAIATPPAPHHDLALAALDAGKHVLCEKPFALDAKQAAAMQRRAAESRLTAMVAHEFRFTPQRAYAKQLLGDGYVGRFRLCTIELFLDRYASLAPRPLTWNAYTAQGGGTLGAMGSHYIDGLRDWFGDVASVSGSLATLRPDLVDAKGRSARCETDDTYAFSLTFKNGGTASMVASLAVTPARGGRVSIMGDEGTLIAEQPAAVPTESGGLIGSRNGAPLQPIPTPAQFTPFTDARDYRLMAFRMLVREFSRGIEQGTSPAPNFTDGLRCQEILDAIRASNATGRVVALN